MNVLLTLTEISCATCSLHFAFDVDLYNRRKDDGRSFYCPNGHSNVFRDSEIDKIKKQLENANKRLGWAETSAESARRRAIEAERSRAAFKGQLTRTRNRIAHGVCPCCKRTFANVASHMSSKHPDFKMVVA